MSATVSNPPQDVSETPGGTTNDRHTVTRRTRLPNGRAVVGGLLIAMSALIAFVITSRPDPLPTTRFAVAAGTIAAGTELTLEDIAAIPLDLPEPLAESAFLVLNDDPSDLVGAVVSDTLSPGEIISRTDITSAADRGTQAHWRISLGVDRANAVDHDLAIGSIVDVVATLGTGNDARTDVVARQATVTHRSGQATGGLADTGEVTVTLSLADGDEVLAVLHASEAGAISLVHADLATSDLPASYSSTAVGGAAG